MKSLVPGFFPRYPVSLVHARMVSYPTGWVYRSACVISTLVGQLDSFQSGIWFETGVSQFPFFPLWVSSSPAGINWKDCPFPLYSVEASWSSVKCLMTYGPFSDFRFVTLVCPCNNTMLPPLVQLALSLEPLQSVFYLLVFFKVSSIFLDLRISSF